MAPVVTAPAVSSPSPSPSARPDATATALDVPDTTDGGAFAATRVIARLPAGSDPIDLVPAPDQRPGAVYIDRATNAVMHVDDTENLRVLMQKGIEDYGRTMDSEPVVVSTAGSDLVVLDGQGVLSDWMQWESVRHVYGSLTEALPDDADVPEEAPPLRIDPPVAMAAKSIGDLGFDLYAIRCGRRSSIRRYEVRGAQGPDIDPQAENRGFAFPLTRAIVTDAGEPIITAGPAGCPRHPGGWIRLRPHGRRRGAVHERRA